MRFWRDCSLSQIIEPSSLDFASGGERSQQGFLGVSVDAWGRVAVLTALFAAVFWPNLHRLWLKTNPFTGEANWGHSIFVPMIGLYYLFVHREDLMKANARQFIWGRFLRPSRLGVAIAMMAVAAGMIFIAQGKTGIAFSIFRYLARALGGLGGLVLLLDWSLATFIFGLAVFVYGIYPGQNDYLKDLGMVITLFGIVLLLTGWDVMRIAWFPIVFLVCAIPWPGLVYSWIAEPLQNMAAEIAVASLNICHVDSLCSGTKIVIYNSMTLPPRILNVAEACAGMRSLMTFISLAGAIAFLSNRLLWQRLIIVFSAVPIAIFCNVMRISGQGLLDHFVGPQWSESYAHQMVGMVMLIPALFLILFVAYLLEKIFIEEADEQVPTIVERTAASAMKASQPKQIPVPMVVPAPLGARATVVPPKPAVTAAPRAVTPSPGVRTSGAPSFAPRAVQRPPAYKPVDASVKKQKDVP